MFIPRNLKKRNPYRYWIIERLNETRQRWSNVKSALPQLYFASSGKKKRNKSLRSLMLDVTVFHCAPDLVDEERKKSVALVWSESSTFGEYCSIFGRVYNNLLSFMNLCYLGKPKFLDLYKFSYSSFRRYVIRWYVFSTICVFDATWFDATHFRHYMIKRCAFSTLREMIFRVFDATWIRGETFFLLNFYPTRFHVKRFDTTWFTLIWYRCMEHQRLFST